MARGTSPDQRSKTNPYTITTITTVGDECSKIVEQAATSKNCCNQLKLLVINGSARF